MPKATFFNIAEDKRNQIYDAALEEFSLFAFTEASLNRICRASKIAKGSFYQYFNDKLDLYTYLLESATQTKFQYFNETMKHLEDLDFIDQIKSLYLSGVTFSMENPRLALLAERFVEEKSDLKELILEGNELKAYMFYETLIEKAKKNGSVRESVNTRALAMLIHSLNNSVAEYMLEDHNLSDYEDNKEIMYGFVDELLNILKYGIK
jgi:AcrR family transcriptional regulator